MNHPPSTNQPPSVDASSLSQLKEEWAELRTLLLAPEQTQLAELRNRIDQTATDAPTVSKVLVEAITLRSRDDERLAAALTPHIHTALTRSVRRTPHVIADALTPIVGTAIRQAIVRTLQGAMQSFNQTLDHWLSPKGLAWRVEAWRTRRPFADVVLLHTLRFRVEHLFLIHRESRLVLHRVAADNTSVYDQQSVPGILTAIQSFLQESSGTPRGQGLTSLEVGDFRVLIEQGPLAILACVVRGTAPSYLRAQLQQTVESIHLDYADALAGFDGNSAVFATTHDRLVACVQSQYETSSSRISPMTVICLSALSLALALWGWRAYHETRQWNHIYQRLGALPGVVITTLEHDGNRVRLAGLRDPLAEDPEHILNEEGISGEQVSAHWTPFYSLDPQFVELRATRLLQPPTTTTLHYNNGELTAIGSASETWATHARQIAPLIPGLRDYHDDGLRVVSVAELVNQISRISFAFDTGSSTLSDNQLSNVSQIKTLLEDLRQTALTTGSPYTVETIGDGDPTGPETMNFLLATARAHAVIAALGGTTPYAPLTITPSVNPSSFAGHNRRGIKGYQQMPQRVTFLVTHKESRIHTTTSR